MTMRAVMGVAVVASACSAPSTPPTSVVVDGITRYTGLDNRHITGCGDPKACGSGDPPAGGAHCSSTVACRVFTEAQSRCQYIHNLEHGHLVLAYNCPSGCQEIVDALNGFHASLPSPKRAIVTPDPLLTTKVAAMVWGYTWSGDAVDLAKLDAIRGFQDRAAPEAGLACNQ